MKTVYFWSYLVKLRVDTLGFDWIVRLLVIEFKKCIDGFLELVNIVLGFDHFIRISRWFRSGSFRHRVFAQGMFVDALNTGVD